MCMCVRVFVCVRGVSAPDAFPAPWNAVQGVAEDTHKVVNTTTRNKDQHILHSLINYDEWLITKK